MGLLKQGSPSKNGDGACFYRHDDGVRKCAVGLILPDEYYHLDMEGKVVYDLNDSFALPRWFRENEDLLATLRDMHDNSYTSSWVAELRNIAFSNDLSTKTMDEYLKSREQGNV